MSSGNDPLVSNPLVTIVVTVFERTTFLEAALRSVLAQGVDDYEIIVTDDSNAPAIRDIVATLADRRIHYRPSIPHKGIARCVADGLSSGRGTFAAILNDDDLWEPDFLEALLRPLQADPDSVLAFSDHWIIDEDGTLDTAATDANSREWGRAALAEGRVREPGRVVVLDKAVPLVMGCLFRRASVDVADITDAVGGAYDYWVSVALAATGQPLHYVPLRLTRYRRHRRMETYRASATKREDELFIVGQVLARGWFPDVTPQMRQRFAALSSAVAINKLRFRQPAAARAVAWAGLRSAFDIRCLAALTASLSPILPHRLLFGRQKPE